MAKVFFFAGKCIPIHAGSLEERALGGTETGLIRVSAELSERGHEVTVFTSHRDPPDSNPKYRHAAEINQAEPCDIFIAVQDWWPVFLKRELGKRLFWTGDAGDQYLTFGIGDKRIRSKIDLLLCVSDWQAHHLSQVSDFPHRKTHVVRNGVHLPWFEGKEERKPKQLIYSSAPYRGLELAAPILQEVLKRHPDCTFEVFAGLDVYAREGAFKGPEQIHFQKVAQELEKIPGVNLRGNIRQSELAREFMRSRLLFYPNIFPETSCITALESMAAGTPVVTSAFAALPETVANGGALIPGTPGSAAYLETFANETCRLLEDDSAWEKLSKQALEITQKRYSWSAVADRFEQAFQRLGL